MKKKIAILTIITIVIALGAFLRAYHFSDWLHFELDQSRDAKVVGLALDEGIGNLPLLGPKAAGSFLRLGPAFYNLEYLSAKIFGHTPSGIAYLSLIFSILTLPIFYLFMRRYFNQKISVALLLIFSVSLFMIMYSRFAWNPNNIPFFSLLTFYSLLRLSDKEERRRGLWLIVFAIAISIVTQLHFLAFIAVPLISLAFIFIKRPRIKIIYWIISLLIILLFYSPPIINDIKTGGDNIKEFQEIFVKKSTKDEHTWPEKIYRNYSENSIGYLLLISSYQDAELPKVDQSGKFSFDIRCDQECRNNLLGGGVAFVFMSTGLILLLFGTRKKYKKRDHVRSDFLILNILWFVATFSLYLPIAYDISPRFFLISAPLAFVFLGLILEFISRKAKEKNSLTVLIVIVLALTILNLIAVKERFSELEKAATEPFDIKTDKILKERDRVTLEQQYLITDYIASIYEKNEYPVYLKSEPFYRRSFYYHLDRKDIVNDDFRNVKKVYRQGNYFLVYPVFSNTEKEIEKYVADFDIVEEKEFGTLIAFRLIPKEASINFERQEFSPEMKARSATGVPVRCRWNEIFAKCNPIEEIGD